MMKNYMIHTSFACEKAYFSNNPIFYRNFIENRKKNQTYLI